MTTVLQTLVSLHLCISPVDHLPFMNETLAIMCEPSTEWAEEAMAFGATVWILDKPKSRPTKVKPKRRSRIAARNLKVPGWVLRRGHKCGSQIPVWYYDKKRKPPWGYTCQ